MEKDRASMTTRPLRVAGFGDNIIDRFLDRGTDYPGGNAVNVAVYAHALGADAAYLGVFGSDDNGVFLRDAVERAGVSTERCVVRRGPTGLSTVRLDNGDRVFMGWNGGGVTTTDPFELDAEDVAYLAGFDLVHSSVYSASEPELPKLRGHDTLVSFDFSSEAEHRADSYLPLIGPHVDFAQFSCGTETDEQTVRLLENAVAAGVSLALATRGSRGAVAFDGEQVYTVAATAVPPDEIVDTMGCGDAFLTAFVLQMLRDGWVRGSPPDPSWIVGALSGAATFAAAQCRVEGAFGMGRASTESAVRDSMVS